MKMVLFLVISLFCISFVLQDETNNILMGVDVSRYQGKLDWKAMENDSVTFVICKATEGINYVDPEFDYNWNTIKEYHLVRGVYHFYRTNDDPLLQANFLIKTIKALYSDDLPCILDIETGGIVGIVDKEKLNSDVLIWLKRIEKVTGKRPIIYTSYYFANEYLTEPSLANYSLWLAEYTTKGKPNIPEVWLGKDWVFWQKSSKKDIEGYSIVFDYDLFNGSKVEFENFLKTN